MTIQPCGQSGERLPLDEDSHFYRTFESMRAENHITDVAILVLPIYYKLLMREKDVPYSNLVMSVG